MLWWEIELFVFAFFVTENVIDFFLFSDVYSLGLILAQHLVNFSREIFLVRFTLWTRLHENMYSILITATVRSLMVAGGGGSVQRQVSFDECHSIFSQTLSIIRPMTKYYGHSVIVRYADELLISRSHVAHTIRRAVRLSSVTSSATCTISLIFLHVCFTLFWNGFLFFGCAFFSLAAFGSMNFGVVGDFRLFIVYSRHTNDRFFADSLHSFFGTLFEVQLFVRVIFHDVCFYRIAQVSEIYVFDSLRILGYFLWFNTSNMKWFCLRMANVNE